MALSIRIRPKFPARVLAIGGINITKVGGTYTWFLSAAIEGLGSITGDGVIHKLGAVYTAGDVALADIAQRSASTLIGNPTGITADPTEVSLGASLSFTGAALGVAVNGVSSAMLRQSVGLSVIGRAASSTGNVADIAGATDQVLRVNTAGTAIGFGQLNIASANAVTGRLAFANLTQGAALSVLGVTGGSTADVASIAGTADQVLRVNGAGTVLGFGTINLASGANAVTGTLAATNGGTGQASYAVGDILFASTTTALSKLADVATGNVLISGGVGVAPAYGKVATAHISNDQITDALLRNSAALSVIGRSANSSGDPADIAGTADQVLRVNGAGTTLGFGQVNLGSAANAVTGTLAVGNGGWGNAGTAWTTYAPAISASTGTLTSATGSGAYIQIGKTLIIRIRAAITTNGTGAGTVIAALPGGMTAIAAQTQALQGFEGAIAGKTITGLVNMSATDVRLRFYDNTYPGANGANIDVNGIIEIQ